MKAGLTELARQPQSHKYFQGFQANAGENPSIRQAQLIGILGTVLRAPSAIRLARENIGPHRHRSVIAMRPILLAALLATATMSAVCAQTAPPASATESSERQSVLDAARIQVQAQLGKPVRLEVQRLRLIDNWAFMHAKMKDPRGQPISYAGTRYEDASQRGQKSTSYDVLLQRKQGQWTVQVDSIGATDVPWTDWSSRYGAPSGLFDDGHNN
jgi:hypothetical protein